MWNNGTAHNQQSSAVIPIFSWVPLALAKWFLNRCKTPLGCPVVPDVYIIEATDSKSLGCWNSWCERLCCFLTIGWTSTKEISSNKACVSGAPIIVLTCASFNWKVSSASVKCVFKNNNSFPNSHKARIEKYNSLLFLLNKATRFSSGASTCWYVATQWLTSCCTSKNVQDSSWKIKSRMIGTFLYLFI